MITLLAAMNKSRVIGVNGKIPWHIPEDFKHFKEYTMGKTIIMGRKTFDSIGRVLPGRNTILLTSSSSPIDGVTICHSVSEILNLLTDNENIVVGGGEVYEQFLPHAQKVVLSIIDGSSESTGVKFPELPSGEWDRLSSTKKEGFTLDIYERTK